MGYPLRDEIPGAYYHVGTRGNNRRDIYSDDTSRLIFLLMVQALAKEHGWRVLAYCLMKNHYHLVIRLSHGGMSRGMQSLNGGYAFAFNQRHGRQDEDLLRTCAYIDLNPLRSFQVEPADWPWSSYRATAGLTAPHGCHHAADLWKHLARAPREAMATWPGFVESCAEGPSLVSDT